ncbi:MAG: SRPBCC domain-containing protein [Bdellovibrionales bacterium]|nr:SRPBCC domain-containing protein [Bdellovibrionales bacterium]
MEKLKFTVQTRVLKPVSDVFSAIVQPPALKSYFVRETTGPMVEGHTVKWTWSDNVSADVKVTKILENKLIALSWSPHSNVGYDTFVEMSFEDLGNNKTMIRITESGWNNDEIGRKSSYENCAGWEHMSTCLKAHLEHGIDLR